MLHLLALILLAADPATAAETAAKTPDVGTIAAIAVPAAGTIGFMVRTAWTRWEKRDDEKSLQIEALSKALSKKSDDQATKVEELMRLVVEGARSDAQANAALLERVLKALAEFTSEVRELKRLLDLGHPPAR